VISPTIVSVRYATLPGVAAKHGQWGVAAQHRLRPAQRREPSPIEHRDALAEAARLGEIVRTQEHGALAAQPRQHLAHLFLLERVESAGRLVDDQKRRIVQEGLRQRDALLIALGQVADQAPRNRFEPERLERVRDALGEPLAAQPARAAHEAQEALDAQIGVEEGGLRDEPEACAYLAGIGHR
jgi:hypothetical protein